MIAELTAEEVVTNLLSSHQILKTNNNVKITSPIDLGTYLSSLPEEIINEDLDIIQPSELAKYSFIKDGGWKF